MASQKRNLFLLLPILLFICLCIYKYASSKKEKVIDRIVLITIDTLRADHLGAYGYPQNTSPFFDQLAKEGILFKNHIASMALTAPSIASSFTSKHVLQHGVATNGSELDDSFLTLAETFQEMGYSTAGISSISTFISSNLHQGFKYFNEPALQKDLERWYRPAEDTIGVAINWLKTMDSNNKFLLWIHLFDPHKPFFPPEDIYDNFLSSSRQLKLGEYLLNQQKISKDFFENNDEMLQEITKYDAEIRYADNEIKRLFQFYAKKGFNKNSLWIITADHGQGLGNHNWFAHGNVYNEHLRIPLLFYFSSKKYGGGQIIENLSENIDVFPTLLELVQGHSPSLNNLEGNSLLTLMLPKLKGTYSKTYAFSQRKVFRKPPPGRTIPNYEEGEKYALQSQRYKYMHRTQGLDEFFDLKNDPHELNNIIGKGFKEEMILSQALLQKIAELKKDAPINPAVVNKEALEQFKSLGYVQ